MNKKLYKAIIVTCIVAIVAVVGMTAFYLLNSQKISKEGISTGIKLELDPEKEATQLSKVGPQDNAYWKRMLDVLWETTEPKQGNFDWEMTDEMVKEMNENDIYPLAMVKPFANWDQDVCHPEKEYEVTDPMAPDYGLKLGKPCDMEAMETWLAEAVERYDGDGEKDMPGLKVPIKYWEIGNEPIMQGGGIGGAGEELKFFVGSNQDYLEILEAAYATIKKADPEAKVSHAGMAGMQKEVIDFWEPILSEVSKNTDIWNMHTISTEENREDLYMIEFKKWLEDKSMPSKPIWITEVQFGSLMGRPDDINSFNELVAKSSVFALALDANKLFYVENWTMWDANEEGIGYGSEKDMDIKREEKPRENYDASTHKVYKNLVNKLNGFDSVKILKQEYDENNMMEGMMPYGEGATSIIGQYKFVDGNDAVYVLWGDYEMPSEITGEVTVTDIYGESKTQNADEVELTDTPIFIQ